MFELKSLNSALNKDTNVWSKSTIDFAEYHHPNVGLFRISDGSKITLFQKQAVTKDLIISQLIFTPMALLMMQRKFLVLHGACIEYRSIKFLLCGPSGSGKTSLLTDFIKDGANYLSEDVVCYDSSDDKIIPSYPLIKYNILELSRNIVEEKIFKIPKDKRNRYLIKTKNSFFNDKKSDIQKVFFLNGFGNLKLDILEEPFKIYRNLLKNSWRSIPSNTCIESQKIQLDNISKFTVNKKFYNFKLSNNIQSSAEYLKDHLF